MRLLILSCKISDKQRRDKPSYSAPYDVHLKAVTPIGDLSDSLFDFDVSVIHIESGYSGPYYYRSIPKILQDSRTALYQGRTIICLPQSKNFKREQEGVYDWLRDFEVALRDNEGEDIKPSGAGRAHVITEYLKMAPKYHQIAIEPQVLPEKRLAVVDDTEIIVGFEHSIGKGTLVVLPPPFIHDEDYYLSMSRLVDVARRYYERAQRNIPVGDSPEWLSEHIVPDAKTLDEQIQKLTADKSEYDRLSYVLYGTGDDLMHSVALLLEKFDLEVKIQPPGANIDLKVKHHGLNIGFAIEVTGTKGIIQKDSSKIAQAWQYLKDRTGTSEENDRLIIVANTECHLNPNQRNRKTFTPDVLKLLGDNVLLMTTLQLYDLWKEVHAKRRSAEDILQELHRKSGLY